MVEPMLALDHRRGRGGAQRAPRERHGAPADDRALRPLGGVRRARHRHQRTRPRRCSGTGPCTATWPPRSRRSATSTRPSCGPSPPSSACREEILAKPPSADLWPGQTDEGELGRTYDLLDRALFALVDRRWSVDRCVAAGLDRALVEWVARRVARMEFKRQPPPVAKLSLRTPGFDHLYPRRRPGSRR